MTDALNKKIMMSQSHGYKPVSKHEEEGELLNTSECGHQDGSPRWGQSKSLEWTRLMIPALWAIGTFFLMAAVGLFMLFNSQSSFNRELLTYSPAHDVVKYHTVVYPDGIHHKTKYMGKPSPEIDAAWEADYDLISRIPKWQAEKLETRPDELPNDPGYYAVMLDIFHSLHCLNEVRMTLNADHYGVPHERLNATEERTKIHLDHCVEHIRLSLWCNADLSPIPFQNGPQGLTASHHYSHTCRDTDAILEWARENKVKAPF